MAEAAAFAEIRLWGRTVGGVAEVEDGGVVFEYDPHFRRSGLEISPLRLPLSLRGPVRFTELLRQEGFRGLPGVLADALPDAFGQTVIRAYYTARGRSEKAFSPVQHLLYVGERALGALTFHPAEQLEPRPREVEALEVAALVADARRIIAGVADVTVPEIYRIGSSAGGLRPKAIVLFNPATAEVRSAFATPCPGDIPALLKFDGVGERTIHRELGEPEHYNRVEAAYARMARDAGLEVVDIHVVESPEGHAHLVIPRFDRRDGERLHQHTLGGLLHVDYNDPGASSYEEYLRTILRLGMPPAAVIEGYRRMVFNVLAVNQDDHVKNLSFHMGPDGTWSLTPAYDLTFARGGGWTATHQMRVADKRADITRSDLLAVAAAFAIRNPGGIIDRVADVLADWPRYARETGVPQEAIREVGAALEERRGAVG
jgi:serine/threonine-protein kinase HipA